MLILVFDTSTRNGTTGWLQIDDSGAAPAIVDFAHVHMPAIPGHAERLLERIDFCLKSGGYTPDDVDLIVVGQGPGTFTGLRIGFSTAKSLSLVHGIPMITVSTLEILACNARLPGMVIALIDARRKELYAGLFELSFDAGLPVARPVGPEVVVRPENVAALLSQRDVLDTVQLVGDGALKYAEQLQTIGRPAHPASAEFSTWIAGLHGYQRFKTHGPVNTAAVEPEYLREPDARKPRIPFGAN